MATEDEMIVVDDVDGENGEETDPRGVLPGGVDLNSELTADEQLALTSKAKETPSRRGEDTATDQTGRDSRRRDDDRDEELRLKRQHIRQNCQVLHIDTRFITHLSEMHPTSALHELCTKLSWPPPNMSVAFECGPPMFRQYIFKAVVNGQTFIPSVAVDNKKDAKANAAWFALQELGFVKKDPANPL